MRFAVIMLTILSILCFSIPAFANDKEISSQEFSSLAAKDSFLQHGDITVSQSAATQAKKIISGLNAGDETLSRSYGCSTGCSSGCSMGCSNGCSVGCSVGCSTGCR
jgi:hypothetical protein